MRGQTIARRSCGTAPCRALRRRRTGPEGGRRPSPRAAIDAANAKFSADFAKGDANAVASHYTSSASAFPPNGEITRGAEAIAKLWKGAHRRRYEGGELTTSR